MERQLESAAQEQAEFEKLESWADLYDNCTFEAKKMIVSQLIGPSICTGLPFGG